MQTILRIKEREAAVGDYEDASTPIIPLVFQNHSYGTNPSLLQRVWRNQDIRRILEYLLPCRPLGVIFFIGLLRQTASYKFRSPTIFQRLTFAATFEQLMMVSIVYKDPSSLKLQTLLGRQTVLQKSTLNYLGYFL